MDAGHGERFVNLIALTALTILSWSRFSIAAGPVGGSGAAINLAYSCLIHFSEGIGTRSTGTITTASETMLLVIWITISP
jgi:hypothetical protein